MIDVKYHGIMAVDNNYFLGDSNTNDMPWSKDEISRRETKWDMVNFKKITSFHPIIMGANTALSLKKPLPNRINIIIADYDRMTNDKRFANILKNIHNMSKEYDVCNFMLKNFKNSFFVFKSLEEFDEIYNYDISLYHKEMDYDNKIFKLSDLYEIYIIGGYNLIKKAIDNNFISSFYLTKFNKMYGGDIQFDKELLKKFPISLNIINNENGFSNRYYRLENNTIIDI